MEDIIDIIVTETTNLIEITSQPTDEIIDVNIIDNREDVTLNVTPTLVEININSLTGNFGILWGEIEGTLSNQTDLQNALNLKADLVDGKVPSSQLPSYVDDVVEVANYAALPVTGEVGKIYITLDTNYIYRWTGSTYVEIKDSSAVWGAITGTLSNQTDLQNALNLKANDNAVVHLAGTETITGAKTLTNLTTFYNASSYSDLTKFGGGSNNVYLYTYVDSYGVGIANGAGFTGESIYFNSNQHYIDFSLSSASKMKLVSGGGLEIGYNSLQNTYKLDVNGTANFAGNITGTNITISNSLIAKGGTFNGGASSSGIITMDGLGSDLLMNRANTSNGSSITLLTNAVEKWNIGLRSAGTTDNFFIYNSNLTANALTINSATSAATFASSATATNFILSGGTGSTGLYYGHTDRVVLANYTTGGIDFEVNGGSIVATLFPSGNYGLGVALDAGYKLDVNGTARITGALSGTSATFTNSLHLDRTGVTAATPLRFTTAGTNDWFIGQSPLGTSTSDLFFYSYGTSSSVFTLAKSTGAATFSSSVTQSASDSRLLGGDSVGRYIISNSDTSAYTSIYGSSHATSANQISLITNSQITFNSGSGYSERMRITSDGIIQLSTTASIPTTNNSIYSYSGNNFMYIQGGSAGLGLSASGSRNNIIYVSESSNYVRFDTSGSERMRITNGGNVGIGTTAPTVAAGMGLVINGGATSPRIALKNNASGDASTDGFQLVLTTENEAVLENRENASMRFLTNATEAMRITSSGNVGIGTSVISQNFSGYTHLDIGNATTGGILLFSNASGTNYGYVNGEAGGVNMRATVGNLTFNTGATERMRITSGGNVLIGTTSNSGQKLVVYSGNTLESSAHLHLSNPNFSGFHWLDGTAYWIGQNSDYRQLRMYSGSNIYTGVYLAAGGSSWSSYSDERMKTNLMPIENATEKVSKLRSMIGRYKTDAQDKKRSFLIAQDVLEVLPEAVNLDTNSGMYGVQYTDVIPLLVASIKELKAELDTLKNK